MYCVPMSHIILKKNVTDVTIPHSITLFSRSSPIIPLNINWLVFVLEMECVLCEVVMPYTCYVIYMTCIL